MGVRSLVLAAVALGCGFQADAHPGADDAAATNDATPPGFDSSMPGIDAAPPSDGAAADWWDVAWRQRVPLHVTNVAGRPLPIDMTVSIGIDLGALSGWSGSVDDLRVVRRTGLGTWQEIPRVIDPTTSTTEWIWFRLSAALAAGDERDDAWLYYANPSPPGGAPSDPTLVFDFVEEFDSLGAGVWSSQNGATASGGELVLPPGDSGVRSMIAWPSGTAVDFLVTSDTSDALFWFGFQHAGDFATGAPFVVWSVQDAGMIYPEYWLSGGSWHTSAPGVVYSAPATPHWFGVDRTNDYAVYRYEHQIAYSEPLPMLFPEAQQIVLRNSSNPMNVRCQALRARATVLPFPTVTLGAPEFAPP